MKTKNSSFGKAFLSKKRFALVEIAIVLCSVFLVALPVIAVEQTTQEVSASTITTASEDDYVLGVYGNANEDDTIDMRDLTYVKLIFFGKKPETELADAKYDGKINPLDFIQIKLIIVGKEKEITIVDSGERIVMVNKPVKRIICLHPNSNEAIRTIGASETVIGVSSSIKSDWYGEIFFPELSKLPSVGSWMKPDIEEILELEPDIVIQCNTDTSELEEKIGAYIPIIRLDFRDLDHIIEDYKKLGYLFDMEEEAEEFANWQENWINRIKSQTEELSEDEKPRVYVAYNYYGGDKASGKGLLNQYCIMAGGNNIAGDFEGNPEIDPEWVIMQNPDVIVIHAGLFDKKGSSGYGLDDPVHMRTLREEIMSRPGWENIDAVKNDRVYLTAWMMFVGPHSIVLTAYYAKWFHPELFEDLDPRAIHQEYLDSFQRIDFNVSEHGVFVYPPLKD